MQCSLAERACAKHRQHSIPEASPLPARMQPSVFEVGVADGVSQIEEYGIDSSQLRPGHDSPWQGSKKTLFRNSVDPRPTELLRQCEDMAFQQLVPGCGARAPWPAQLTGTCNAFNCKRERLVGDLRVCMATSRSPTMAQFHWSGKLSAVQSAGLNWKLWALRPCHAVGIGTW